MSDEAMDSKARLRALIDQIDAALLVEAEFYLGRLARSGPDQSGLLATMGLEVLERGDGRVLLEVEGGPHLMNPNGVLHGAVLFAAMDTAMGGAVTSLLNKGEICATVEAKINYLSAVRGGKLRAEARVVQKGGRIAVAQATATAEDGRLAGLMTGTFMVLEGG
ncbi:MAG TPA: PaaI family thioesterase [Dehalococcoidia bacterium]|nr:PaaI family thioesterase [Dehalococcoidia bacterium]